MTNQIRNPNDQMPTRRSHRMEKVNKELQRTIGEVLAREADLPEGVMVTVSRVDTTRNLQTAHVWLSVFPEGQAQAVLDQLTLQLYDLQGACNRQLHMRPLPRIRLHIDHGATHAEHIERRLRELT